ncbi:MAG: glycosyl hydrolase family 28-related protein [Sphingomicrobium sp.]
MAILTIIAAAWAATTVPTMGALALDRVGDRGARVGFVEYEAENAVTDGEAIGPSRRFTTLAAEASGRRAVRLGKAGQSVRFTLAAPANALTVRYAIPDSSDGAGRDAKLGVYVGAERVGALKLTSRYGWFYGRYPFSNHPSDGLAHHFYDEARLLIGRNLPAGAEVRLVAEAGAAPWTIVDLADFEQVAPPLEPPPGALSIVRFGADPAGRRDSRRAITRTIAEARRRGVAVFVPSGHFRIDGHVLVDRVTIVGAGPWYSVLRGRGAGIYGTRARAVTLKDFAIIGEVRRRVDRQALAGIGGTMGGGSLLSNLWLQHHKVGVWLDGPLDGLTVRGLRIIDNTADGLNLRGGATHVTIEHNFVRNSGDDGLALWSHRGADADVTIRHNSVIAPILANGIAVYGGRDIVVSGNLVADTLTQGGGIHVGQRFSATKLSGRIVIDDNLLVRSGSFDPNWRFGIGALWFYALDRPIDVDIAVGRTEIVDATLPAIQFIGKSIGKVAFDGLRITGAHHVLQLQSEGAASFANVAVEGVAAGIARCSEAFALQLLDNSRSLSDLPALGCAAISVPRP